MPQQASNSAARSVSAVQLLAVTAAIAIPALAVANTGLEPGEEGGLGPFIASSLIGIGVAAAFLLGVAGRVRDPGSRGSWSLGLGVAALVSVLAFWSGLPFGLGMSAVGFGLWSRAASANGGGAAVAGTALGGLAVVLAVIGAIVG